MPNSPCDYDLLIIGGGINGVGIAADAAGRGLRVRLCEMGDLGSATSSRSSKLIHGGLRYLEYREFGLVRKALHEREILLRIAPHIIWPLRFCLPHCPQLRPAWMIRAGLFLYDHLSGVSSLPNSGAVRFAPDGPLQPRYVRGFEYSDAWVDDARLVILNALAARQRGATISPRCRVVGARRREDCWQVDLCRGDEPKTEQVSCRALVNATGPWVGETFGHIDGQSSPARIRTVKGSHIVVPRIDDSSRAWILQNTDRRIIFVLPFEEQFSLIGTTDIEHQGDPGAAAISETETDYLLAACNRYFRRGLSRASILYSFAGVRPLVDEPDKPPQALGRDYRLELNDGDGQAPLLSVFGGKITTYRVLAEAALAQLSRYFPAMGPCQTITTPLPGGDFSTPSELADDYRRRYPWLAEDLLQRLIRSYGTLSTEILGDAGSQQQLGHDFGAGLYEREVRYLIEREWAQTTEDILWRRSKRGLFVTDRERQQLEQYLQRYRPQQPPARAASADSGH